MALLLTTFSRSHGERVLLVRTHFRSTKILFVLEAIAYISILLIAPVLFIHRVNVHRMCAHCAWPEDAVNLTPLLPQY